MYKTLTTLPPTANIFDRMYNNHKRHVFTVSETGGGSTTLLLGAIEHIHALTKGTAEFYGSAVKKNPWLGLECQKAPDGQLQILTLEPTNPSTIESLIDRLRYLQKQLKNRQYKRYQAEQVGQNANFNRVYIILEDWHLTLAIAKEYDRVCNLSRDKGAPRSDIGSELVSMVESFLLLGREDEFCVWIFAQDHLVQNSQINTGMRNNFGFVIPAIIPPRIGTITSGLEHALIGRSPITAPSIGGTIYKDVQRFAEETPETGICYSNICGDELLVFPNLPDIKRKRIFPSPL